MGEHGCAAEGPNTKTLFVLQFPELLYFVGKRVNEDLEDIGLKEAFEVHGWGVLLAFDAAAP